MECVSPLAEAVPRIVSLLAQRVVVNLQVMATLLCIQNNKLSHNFVGYS